MIFKIFLRDSLIFYNFNLFKSNIPLYSILKTVNSRNNYVRTKFKLSQFKNITKIFFSTKESNTSYWAYLFYLKKRSILLYILYIVPLFNRHFVLYDSITYRSIFEQRKEKRETIFISSQIIYRSSFSR